MPARKRFAFVLLTLITSGCYDRTPAEIEYEIVNPHSMELLMRPKAGAPYPQQRADGSLLMRFDAAKIVEYNPDTWPSKRWTRIRAHDQHGTPITSPAGPQVGAKYLFRFDTFYCNGDITARLVELPSAPTR